MITPKKWQQLYRCMTTLGIRKEDLVEKFILGSGSGGQKINKTSSCVSLKHIPSGMVVKCQEGRSREMNRYTARQRLCEKIDQQIHQEKSEAQQLIQKIRQQKKRRSRKLKKKILADKRHRSVCKQTRKKPIITIA
ncbi:MAG: peptide chain release factor 1 [Gammaproteobacteria bacterium RIFCSPHIGHO2_02_FULL_39_13]|nr:MAG: peptide chain release factor 1 [Gammaproteobacteria bacterium RIFCSPHIGHO2_02_FULL_39_13]